MSQSQGMETDVEATKLTVLDIELKAELKGKNPPKDSEFFKFIDHVFKWQNVGMTMIHVSLMWIGYNIGTALIEKYGKK